MNKALTTLVLLLTAGVPVPAQQPQHPTAVTQHTVKINGQDVAYTATVAEDLIADDQGHPGAAVVTIAYTRDGVSDMGKRPVLFAFNGGPGASSSPLHMNALGPLVREGDGYAPNATSPLDAADLVFIDPVSTGFSRALPGVDPRQWYGGKADAVEVATVIRDWLAAHHRERSPRFLAGESYGTTRAALIAKYVPDLRFNGVILISGGGGGAGASGAYLDTLPNFAAGAWFHGMVDRQGKSVEQFYSDARAFARGGYAAALAKGAGLTPEERHVVAARMAQLIGLSSSFIEDRQLKISPNDWMFNLLKDKGLRAGLLDSRATGKWCPNMQGAIDDPAMGFVSSQTCAPPDQPPTPATVGPRPSSAVARFLNDQLKFADTDSYYGVNFTANSQWRHDPSEESTAQIMARAMQADPRLSLAAISGLFDLLSNDGDGFAKAGVPVERLHLLRLAGGHEVYSTTFGGNHDRQLFDDAVREFVTTSRP